VREVCFIVSAGAVVWADASSSPAALADSRARWQAIWHHRDALDAIAHSHPLGPRAFSAEDESTMAAIDAALGKPTCYIVVAPTGAIARLGARGRTEAVRDQAWWIELLRLASGFQEA
jgi:hypothetical protein